MRTQTSTCFLRPSSGVEDAPVMMDFALMEGGMLEDSISYTLSLSLARGGRCEEEHRCGGGGGHFRCFLLPSPPGHKMMIQKGQRAIFGFIAG